MEGGADSNSDNQITARELGRCYPCEGECGATGVVVTGS